jgi:hypothetical protein
MDRSVRKGEGERERETRRGKGGGGGKGEMEGREGRRRERNHPTSGSNNTSMTNVTVVGGKMEHVFEFDSVEAREINVMNATV